jgi:hypothetical protein
MKNCSALLFALSLGFAHNAAAQVFPPPPPTKQIVIYNNSDQRIYPVITVGAKTGPAFDLWLQAQFNVSIPDEFRRIFQTAVTYRAYVNSPNGPVLGGIPPTSQCSKPPCSVTITVPFYTQLQPVNTSDVGLGYDKFIDWWNGARVLSFDGLSAMTAALITYGNCTEFTTCPPSVAFPPQKVIPNSSVPTANKIIPSCTNSDNSPCTVSAYAYTIDPLPQFEFQLDEYTFASAIGGQPEPGKPPQFVDNYDYVNYNISAVDSIYASTAMGPLNAKPPIETNCTVGGNTCYLGSPLTNDAFNQALNTFSNNGKNYPYYVPLYFKCDDGSIGNPNCTTGTDPNWPKAFYATCSLAAFSPPPYLLPKVPGAYDLLNQSYKGIPSSSPPGTAPPIPPVLSSQPPNYLSLPGYVNDQCIPPSTPPYSAPVLGTAGQVMVDLWTKCANPATTDSSTTCKDIAILDKFFRPNYAAACTNGTPDSVSILNAVYGWVPITYPEYGGYTGKPQCTGRSLALTADYDIANQAYCRLQYNYLTETDQSRIFNPYTKLLHKALQSSAYAFSIDDNLAFRHLRADGIIITIGGLAGLQNQAATPIPQNPSDVHLFCRGAGGG